jgi:hypothetical protein
MRPHQRNNPLKLPRPGVQTRNRLRQLPAIVMHPRRIIYLPTRWTKGISRDSEVMVYCFGYCQLGAVLAGRSSEFSL